MQIRVVDAYGVVEHADPEERGDGGASFARRCAFEHGRNPAGIDMNEYSQAAAAWGQRLAQDASLMEKFQRMLQSG